MVNSRAEASELKWARENIKNAPEESMDMEKIKDGKKPPLTLQALKKHGVESDEIAYFSVGVFQAFGIPACMIQQPGGRHAYIWRNEKWQISNGKEGRYKDLMFSLLNTLFLFISMTFTNGPRRRS